MCATVATTSQVGVARAGCGRLTRACATIALAGLVALVGLVLATDDGWAEDELNLYSHRQPFLIEPFLEAFTAETGIKVNVVYASTGLAQRLQAEGRNSPADVVLTVDIARLAIYADKDLLAPVESAVLTEAGAGPSARSRRALVRPFQAGAGDRGLQGSRGTRCDRDLRGPG